MIDEWGINLTECTKRKYKVKNTRLLKFLANNKWFQIIGRDYDGWSIKNIESKHYPKQSWIYAKHINAEHRSLINSLSVEDIYLHSLNELQFRLRTITQWPIRHIGELGEEIGLLKDG